MADVLGIVGMTVQALDGLKTAGVRSTEILTALVRERSVAAVAQMTELNAQAEVAEGKEKPTAPLGGMYQ